MHIDMDHDEEISFVEAIAPLRAVPELDQQRIGNNIFLTPIDKGAGRCYIVYNHYAQFCYSNKGGGKNDHHS